METLNAMVAAAARANVALILWPQPLVRQPVLAARALIEAARSARRKMALTLQYTDFLPARARESLETNAAAASCLRKPSNSDRPDPLLMGARRHRM